MTPPARTMCAFQRSPEDVRGWPCEVDAAPPRGRDGVANLERSKRSWEEDARTARLGEQPAGTLAAYWLASGPAGFVHMPRNG
jgi:hypothetical protein